MPVRKCKERSSVGGQRGTVYASATAVCFGAISSGTVISWTANIRDKLESGQLNGLQIETTKLKWTASIMIIGSLLACIPTGILLDTIGRKITMMLATVPFYVGWVCIIFASNEMMLYTGRFITGLGVGAFSVSCPLYAGEIAQKEIKGRVVCFFYVFVSIGSLYANFFGWFMPIKLFIFACVIVPFVFNAMFYFQPASPVYSIQSGEEGKAVKTLKSLRGRDFDVTPEIQQIKAELLRMRGRKSFFQVFKNRGIRKATLICLSITALKHLSSVAVVHIYASSLLHHLEYLGGYQFYVMLLSLLQVVGALLAATVIERFGRRILLVLSFGCMSLSCWTMAAFFLLIKHRLPESTVKQLELMPVFALIVYNFGYAAGVGTITYLAPIELYPADVRSKFNWMIVTFGWFMGFVMTISYFDLLHTFGAGAVYIVFGSFSMLGAVIMALIYPDTLGKTPLQIIQHLEVTPIYKK